MTYNHLLIIALCFLVPPSVSSQNRMIWDGELTTDNCQTEWGRRTDSIAHGGTHCFQAYPDPWHGPGIRLHCTPSWRVNLSGFDELRFWVKSNMNTPRTLNLSIYGWPNVSRGVEVSQYLVGGGTIGTDWKEARIPIDSLKSATFRVGVTEIIYFGGPIPPTGYQFFIDDVWAHDLKPTKVTGVKVISDKVLRLDIADRYDTTAVKNLNNYFITSPDDEAFSTPQYPSSLSMHYYVEDFDPADNYNNPIPILNFQLFPIFNTKFKNGKTYTITVTSVKDMAANEFATPYSNTFVFNDLAEITGTVKANHVGYLPTRPKYGYIGNFLGGMEQKVVPLSITTPPTFQIRRVSDNSTAFAGTAVLRLNYGSTDCGAPLDRTIDTRWSGEIVYSCDFSTLTESGDFYLYSAGYGRSYPFRIAADVYDNTAKMVARSLYLNRCGIALTPQNAGDYSRPICHATDGVLHASVGTSPLNEGEVAGTTHTCARGWHDAGDYGKYIASATQPLHDIFLGFELFPEKFPDNFNNIPESGNGVPDMLDEAKWEVDWLLTMQAPDGGGYFKICTSNWPNWMPNNDNATRWIAEKTTHSTGQLAALLAAAARIYRPYFPVYADTCLAKARRSWAWMERHPSVYPLNGYKNPTGMGGGEFPDPGERSDIDERAWAAAELYKTTGESYFHDKFAQYWTQNDPAYGWNDFQHHQHKASYTYWSTKNYPTNAAYIKSFKDAIRIGLDNYVIPRMIDKTAYRASYRSEVIPWIAWGSWGISMTNSWTQIKASYLLGKDYLNSAAINMDVQLGNNPQNRSYITGVGFDPPMDPLHHPSNTDAVAAPYPGLCVFGPHSNMGGVGYAGASQHYNNLYPWGYSDCMPYPTLRRYYDVFENIAMNEPTRGKEAMTAVVLAFFSSQNVAVLAADLLDFKGQAEKTSNQLTWTFADTKDLATLTLEKSKDGQDFTPLSIFRVSDVGFQKTEGHGLDDMPFDVTYYRLKMTELAGKTTYSKVISIKRQNSGAKNNIKVHPNPATDELTIENAEGKDIEIVNALGQVVLSSFSPINHLSLTINHLKSGIYFVKTADEVVRFVKN